MTVRRGYSNTSSEGSLLDYLYRGLRSQKDVKRKGRLWASQAPHCSRRGALTGVYEGTQITRPANQGYFSLGIAIENMILNAWDKNKLVITDQYRLPEVGLNLGGKVDAVVLLNGKLRIVEIKSCGDKIPTSGKREHLSQARFYSAVTGFPMYLFYFSRNVAHFNGKLKSTYFYEEFNKDTLQYTVHNAALARLSIDNTIIPEIGGNIRSIGDCGFCDFVGHCWKGDELTISDRNGLTEQYDYRQYSKIVNEAIQFTQDFFLEDNIDKRRQKFLRDLVKPMKKKGFNDRILSDFNDGRWQDYF